MKTFLLMLFLSLNVQAKPIIVAIIDGGLSDTSNVHLCADGLIDMTGEGTQSYGMHHGDNITHIITDHLDYDSYCVYHIKIFKENMDMDHTADAFKLATRLKADVINYSGGGIGQSYQERRGVKAALDAGIIIIAAAGNTPYDLDADCKYFPACYKGVIAVGNLYNKSSGYGKKNVDMWRNGNNVTAGGVTLSGTSQATAIVTHEIVLKLIRHLPIR